MVLSEFRKMFVKLSGRYDLVKDTETYEDDGADFLINAGVRMLDRMFTHTKSSGQVKLDIKANQATYDIPSLLSVEGIQRGSDEGRITLTHLLEHEIREKDPTLTSSTGKPRFYAVITSVRDAILKTSKVSLERITIKLFPTPDEVFDIWAFGRMSIPLEEEDDYNFWTLKAPEVLISATMYHIERFHRNSQGMQDHMRAIRQDLRELDGDAIESQMGSITQMRDSFKFRGEGDAW